MKPTTWLLGLLVLAGCASAGGASPATDPAVVALSLDIDASMVTGTWRGNYVCSQGVTNLTLTLTGHRDGRVDGTFQFYAHPENPGVPRGSYRVHGRLSPTGRILTLDTGEWIEHPRDYWPVGLVGRVEDDRYYGFVDFIGCETFSLTRG